MDDQSRQRTTGVRAALYARVSCEQQAQQSTIDSQIVALKDRIQADGLTLDVERCFADDGYSGSTLIRPALERLRDTAWAGGFTHLYVHSPDRLARKYAWQVLLLEELQRSGVELVFLNRTIGVSPEEDLLLQMQGMIAGPTWPRWIGRKLFRSTRPWKSSRLLSAHPSTRTIRSSS